MNDDAGGDGADDGYDDSGGDDDDGDDVDLFLSANDSVDGFSCSSLSFGSSPPTLILLPTHHCMACSSHGCGC